VHVFSGGSPSTERQSRHISRFVIHCASKTRHPIVAIISSNLIDFQNFFTVGKSVKFDLQQHDKVKYHLMLFFPLRKIVNFVVK